MTYHLVSTPFTTFLEKGDKYSLKKKPPKDLRSLDVTINEIMETITTNENNTDSDAQKHKPTNKDLKNLYWGNALTSHHTHQIK